MYVDSSVVLATVFAESRRPDDRFWLGPRFASRLADLEVRVRAAGRANQRSSREVEAVLAQMQFVEMSVAVLRLLYTRPPAGVRTLDAIHLATLEHLHQTGHTMPLATYDRRLATAAHAMGFQVIVP